MDAPAPTLLDVATTHGHANRETATRFLVACGHKLHLLCFFMRHICGQLAPNAARRTPPPPPEADAPLLALAVYRPAAMWAYNDALLTLAPAHMPPVDPGMFRELAELNHRMATHADVPDHMGALVFWWIAAAHGGVYDAIRATEPAGSWWAGESRLDALAAFVAAHIDEITSHDMVCVHYYAEVLHASMLYVVGNRALALCTADGRERPRRLSKETKEAIIAQRQKQKSLQPLTTS